MSATGGNRTRTNWVEANRAKPLNTTAALVASTGIEPVLSLS